MKHYSSADWADFANQVTAPEHKADMESHLKQGCTKCSQTLQTWQRVHEIAQRESTYEPPASSVKSVKGAFAFYGPRKSQRRVLDVVQLVFDSLRQPLPAGVRSMQATTRKVLYRCGNLRIDLNLELLAASERIAVDGQVLDASVPGRDCGKIPVVALSARKRLAETETNQFGEFHLECETGKNLRLSIQIAEGAEISIPLADQDPKGSLER